MVISVLLSHPRPGSFNHAIAAACAGALRRLGHEVRVHDLDAERFDPALPAGELRVGGAAAGARRPPLPGDRGGRRDRGRPPELVGAAPRRAEGMVDRVLRAGVAYRFVEGDGGEGVPVGLLRARSAIVLNTSNTPPDREAAAFGDPLETIWRNCIFGLCGVATVERRTFSVVVTSTAEQRARWLEEAQGVVARHFPG